MTGAFMNSARRHRRSLDFRELRESSLLADLVQSHIDDDVRQADPFELAMSPILQHWSIADGPRLMGVDEGGTIQVLDVWSVSRDYAWASTADGIVRLGEQARIPLVTETGR
jgi:hypothetical protein